MSKLINVYCDESRHLLCKLDNIMVLGAIYSRKSEVKVISEKIRSIKRKYKLSRNFEIKWTKISPSKVSFYLELVDYFFDEPRLKFRAILIPDKSKLDHDRFNQSHDDWYYKMYYVLLKWIVRIPHVYHFYLDMKDTKGFSKTKKLEDYLAKGIYDYQHECVSRVQQIRSHESELLQLADLFIGAVSYANWSETMSTAKGRIVERIESHLPKKSLKAGTSYNDTKFNLFIWDAC